MKNRFVHIFALLLTFAACTQGREYVNLNQPAPAEDSLVQALSATILQTVSMPCSYESADQFGEPVTLSGKVYFPKDKQAKRIVIQAHFTSLSNTEIPSASDRAESVLRTKNYVLLQPDYLGYGISSERDHPYLACDVAARNVVDMLLAARDFTERMGIELESDSVVLIGYSQGAHAILAALRLLETEYPEIPIQQCYIGGGPYDVARTYDVTIGQDNVGIPFTVPFLIYGTSCAYGLNLDLNYFLKPKALARAKKYVFSQNYTAAEVQLLGKVGASHKVSKQMRRQGMDKTQPESKRLYDGLIRSSIVHVSETDTILGDWTPRTPIFMLHSTQDTSVPYENAESLQLMFERKGANVRYDLGNFGGHISALLRFLSVLDKEL